MYYHYFYLVCFFFVISCAWMRDSSKASVRIRYLVKILSSKTQRRHIDLGRVICSGDLPVCPYHHMEV